MTITNCVQCGSEKIIPDLEIRSNAHSTGWKLEVEIKGKPNATIFKESHKEVLSANVYR